MIVRRAIAAILLLGLAAAVMPVRRLGAVAGPPVAIIGIDGADWMAIDRLVAAKKLPAFAALKRLGATGIMRAEPPLLSPIIWTTIATGRRPEDHGVLDFMVDVRGGGQAPVSGGARATKALWEMFSDAGRPVFVAGWWATWPADHVRGTIISDRVAAPHVRVGPATDGLVYPRDRLEAVLAARVRPEDIDYNALNRFVPLGAGEFDEAAAADRTPGLYRNRFAHARAALAAARTYRRETNREVPRLHPAFAAVYYELVDTIEHLFIGDPARRDIAIASAYAEIDAALADTARALDPETLILVVSDHGFLPVGAGIAEDPADLTAGAAAWHRPYGIAAAVNAGALAGLSPSKGPQSLGTVSPLDIAPTVLAYAHLPVARDMPGAVLRAIATGPGEPSIASYGRHQQIDQPASPAAAPDSMELERLRALGYVTGSTTTSLARVNLGEVLFRKGDLRGAATELEAVLRADPLNQRAALWLARAYAAASRVDDAERVYDRLLRLAASGERIDPVAVLAATDLDLEHQMASRAAERLERLPGALARTAAALVARGSVADAQGRPADAERAFRQALAAEPADAEAISRLVDLLLRSGRAAAAFAAASDAVRRFPDSPERRALLGETLLAERQYDEAARAFRSALAVAPDSASVRIDLARAELLTGRPDAALDALEGVASRDAEALRGAASAKKRDWASAVRAYERAVASGAPTTDLLNALGAAQLESGRTADAIRTLERSLAANPQQPQVKQLLERARGRTGSSPPHHEP